MKKIVTITLSILIYSCAFANIQLPAVFSDHMVLQQNSDIMIWGWGKPNEEIKLTVSWDTSKEYSVTVLSQGTWNITFRTPEAGGPFQMTLKGYNSIEINDILIGEVWLGSGQSNMEWSARMHINNEDEEISKANFPEIRFFTVYSITATVPQQLVQGQWVRCTPETMANFSALMYFFGRELHQKVKVPVGLIHSSWGGTPIEVWTPESYIRGDRALNENANKLNPVPWGPVEPGRAYNAMINPLIPFRIKGVIWYQGEANTDNASEYSRGLKTLIGSWRAGWGYDFPFYYAQIAPWSGYGTDNVKGAVVRDQQRKALQITEHTGMAVLTDVGDLKNIHPGNKQEAGRRLALWTLHQDYGFSDLSYSGPLFSSFEMKKDKIIIHFDYADGGLVAKDGDLREFEISEDNGSWVSIPAKINGLTVEADLKGINSPKALRFAYHNDSNPNLFNKSGLPASCFETQLTK
jgi:sialate O-acetylesterase